MSEQSSFRPVIRPWPYGASRPLWSVMIPTYNCATYLRQTLASVLDQDPGSDVMEIEVVDDHSSDDDPFPVVEELGKGRVGFYRQPENRGHVENFNTCLIRSRGRLIHLLHGDDCVRDGFYRKMQQAFEQNPSVGAAFCRYIVMDESSHWQSIWPLERPNSGILENWLEKIAVGQRLQTPAMVVRRSVYERLGGFDSRIHNYGEDWEMWVRIAAHYPIWYEVEPLAVYRRHSGSLSGRSLRTGENAMDLRRVIEINQAHLPRTKAVQLSNRARENFARACVRRAHRLLNAGNKQASLVQVQEALKTSRSLNVLGQTAFVLARLAWQSISLGASRDGE